MPLDLITSDALAPAQHGFFTRKGGVSTGIYDGLNCGTGSRDLPENITENRGRVSAALGNAPLIGAYQVHSPDVVTVTAPLHAPIKADALVTKTPSLALTILTADCQPVLFHDAAAGVIGAAHAGWKGALHGVLENTIDAMIAQGASRANIHAVIGPCISQDAYEVGREFQDNFLAQSSEYGAFFREGAPGKYMFDLPAFGLHRLRTAKIHSADWVGLCTYADPSRFYSYRRTTHAKEPDYGRLIAAISL